MIAGATDEGLCLLEFSDRRMLEAQFDSVRRLFGGPGVMGTNEHLEQLQAELAGYFAGSMRQFTVPLVYPGTAFQRQVWEQLLQVPYGQTRSYQELAASLGNPAAVRAVGRANGMNRIATLIPCHRIVNKNGDLGGYPGLEDVLGRVGPAAGVELGDVHLRDAEEPLRMVGGRA